MPVRPVYARTRWLPQRIRAEILLEMGENIWRIKELYLDFKYIDKRTKYVINFVETKLQARDDHDDHRSPASSVVSPPMRPTRPTQPVVVLPAGSTLPTPPLPTPPCPVIAMWLTPVFPVECRDGVCLLPLTDTDGRGAPPGLTPRRRQPLPTPVHRCQSRNSRGGGSIHLRLCVACQWQRRRGG